MLFDLKNYFSAEVKKTRRNNAPHFDKVRKSIRQALKRGHQIIYTECLANTGHKIVADSRTKTYIKCDF